MQTLNYHTKTRLEKICRQKEKQSEQFKTTKEIIDIEENKIVISNKKLPIIEAD